MSRLLITNASAQPHDGTSVYIYLSCGQWRGVAAQLSGCVLNSTCTVELACICHDDQRATAVHNSLYARQAMLRAHKKGLVSYTYTIGDQVKVSTEHLVPRVASTQRPKLQPRNVGPFEMIEQVNAGA